jgi:type I restriction enzyme S subunit
MSDGWRRVPAASVARIEIGGTPAREQPTFWADQDSGHAWASIADLNSEVVVETAEYISDLGVKSSNVKLVPTGTPIMSFKLTIGRTSLAGRDLYTNEAIAAFFADRTQMDPRFLFHALPGAARFVITDVAIKGATLNKKSLSSMQLLLPPIGEQRRIAKILDVLGDQINSTERIIAKVRTSRSALVERLITREWRNATLASALLGAPANGIYKPAHLIGRGALLVGQTAINSERRVTSALARRAVVTSSEAQRFGLISGDILVSRVFATLEGVGQPALLEQLDETAVYESNMMRLRCDGSRADPFFIFQTLLTSSARAHVVRRANLSNQASISQTVLTGLPVWLPSIDQQLRVGQALRSVESEIAAERARLMKLQAVKSGLMADLLTGRVRVPEETA